MSDTILKFVEALKTRLSKNKSNFLQHNSMEGSTETGFYSTDDFDFDEMIKEIDEFSREFNANRLEK